MSQTLAAKCIAKQSNQNSSTVRFAVDPKETTTPQGPGVTAKTAIVVSFSDATSADGFSIGKDYNIAITEA